MVKDHLPEVKPYLPVNGYCLGMTTKAGARKGVTKRRADLMAPGFETRLTKAKTEYEKKHGTTSNENIGKMADTSKQLIGDYLGGKRTSPSVVIALKLARGLGVSPYWLILNEGEMSDIKTPTPPVGQTLTAPDEQFKLFLINKNPAYRELAEAFVRGVRALGPDIGWVGDLEGEHPRKRTGHGTVNPTSKSRTKRKGH